MPRTHPVARRMTLLRDLVVAAGLVATGSVAGWHLVAACTPPLDVAASTRYAGHAAWCLSRPCAPGAQERWATWFYSPEGARDAVVLKTVNLRGTRRPRDPV